jgi:hypothetical protein
MPVRSPYALPAAPWDGFTEKTVGAADLTALTDAVDDPSPPREDPMHRFMLLTSSLLTACSFTVNGPPQDGHPEGSADPGNAASTSTSGDDKTHATCGADAMPGWADWAPGCSGSSPIVTKRPGFAQDGKEPDAYDIMQVQKAFLELDKQHIWMTTTPIEVASKLANMDDTDKAANVGEMRFFWDAGFANGFNGAAGCNEITCLRLARNWRKIDPLPPNTPVVSWTYQMGGTPIGRNNRQQATLIIVTVDGDVYELPGEPTKFLKAYDEQAEWAASPRQEFMSIGLLQQWANDGKFSGDLGAELKAAQGKLNACVESNSAGRNTAVEAIQKENIAASAKRARIEAAIRAVDAKVQKNCAEPSSKVQTVIESAVKQRHEQRLALRKAVKTRLKP